MISYLKWIRNPALHGIESKHKLLIALRANTLTASDFITMMARFNFNERECFLLLDKKHSAARLTIHEAELVIRLAELYELGLETFDHDAQAFRHWIETPIPALENQTPQTLITSWLGIDLVKEELLRIEHGVY